VHELVCAGGATPLLLVNTLHGPEAKPSPYADLAPPRGQVFRSSSALKKAAKRAFERLGRREQTSVCRTSAPAPRTGRLERLS
jgi:hypothetical protein